MCSQGFRWNEDHTRNWTRHHTCYTVAKNLFIFSPCPKRVMVKLLETECSNCNSKVISLPQNANTAFKPEYWGFTLEKAAQDTWLLSQQSSVFLLGHTYQRFTTTVKYLIPLIYLIFLFDRFGNKRFENTPVSYLP